MRESIATLKGCHGLLRAAAELLTGLERRDPTRWRAARVRPIVETALDALVREFPALAAELGIDELVLAEGWEHPTEVLDPCPPFGELLRLCEARLERARREERSHLEEVRRKIARAKRFAEEAKKKQQRLL